MVNSNAVRDWADSRGIFYNKEKNFLVWVNEEDHCRVISMQQGGSMQKTFQRFCVGLQKVSTTQAFTQTNFDHAMIQGSLVDLNCQYIGKGKGAYL
jgi:creatine kinase